MITRHSNLILPLLLASSALAQSTPPHKIWEGHASPYGGYGISSAGDLDQDGHTDFMTTDLGGLKIRSGLDQSILLTIGVKHDYWPAPWSCCTLGDVSEDGLPDYAVSSYSFDNYLGDNVGGFAVYSGGDGSLLYYETGTVSDMRLASALEPAGDVNGDGFCDLMVGTSSLASREGWVKIHSGADGSLLYDLYGDEGDLFGDDNLGASIASAGDVNQDGYDDFIIGATLDDGFGLNHGMARVYSGFDGRHMYEIGGGSIDSGFGYSVDGGMDANGDGIPDFVVFALSGDGHLQSRTYCYSGSTGSLLWSVECGWGVASFVGDINGDGFDDIAVPERAGDALEILSGPSGAVMWSLDPEFGGWRHGREINPIGDADGDGNDDFIATAEEGTDMGNMIYVYGGVGNSHELTLTLQGSFIAGTKGRALAQGAAPGSMVHLFCGKGHGRTYTPNLGPVDLINARYIDAAISWGGSASFSLNVPVAMVGVGLWLQAVNGSGMSSNVAYAVVQ